MATYKPTGPPVTKGDRALPPEVTLNDVITEEQGTALLQAVGYVCCCVRVCVLVVKYLGVMLLL